MHLFSGMYEADIKGGRPSIAPEKLLRAMLLQVFYSIRSERQLMEQTQYNLLFRWFIGLSMDDAVWVPTVFTKNRERLIAHDAVIEFFNGVLEQAEDKGLAVGRAFQCRRHAHPGVGRTQELCAQGRPDDAATAATSKAKPQQRHARNRTPMPMHGCTAKARPPASCATWATRSPTTATDWWPTPWSPPLMAMPSAKRPRP